MWNDPRKVYYPFRADTETHDGCTFKTYIVTTYSIYRIWKENKEKKMATALSYLVLATNILVPL